MLFLNALTPRHLVVLGITICSKVPSIDIVQKFIPSKSFSIFIFYVNICSAVQEQFNNINTPEDYAGVNQASGI